MAELKVLVVDDEPGIRSGIKRSLSNFTVGYPFMEEDFSFDIQETGTGEEALEIIAKEKTDIVLLDNQLPGISGMEVLEQISNRGYESQVMMITSYASLELAVKATNTGAFNFVPKPFTPQELKAEMENITKHLFLKRMTRKMNAEGRHIRFQFLSVLSHELKSPVNAIEGYLNVMKFRQAGDDFKAYEQMIDRSLERLKGMRNLIMDLLDLTKIESGKKSRELKKLDLAEVIIMARDSIEPIAIQKNVSVHLEFNGGGLYMQADRDEMDIILNNLISNAVKYNRDGGEVFVNVEDTGSKYRINVRDTGIGMTQEEQGKLFVEFVRIKNEKTKNITGSGLGLSIVKKIVSLAGGEVLVDSVPDKGSTFSVILPK